MKKNVSLLFLIIISSFLISFNTLGRNTKTPKPLDLGYSIGIDKINPEKMKYAKSVGIDYIEVSPNGLVSKDRSFNFSDEEMIEKMEKAKNAAEEAGIKIWSIHMPFGPNIDLSLANEEERRQVVALHQKLLGFFRILQPEIVLFHPSFYLGLNEREIRKNQMIKSAVELNKTVRDMNATMVIENMLGYELNVDAERERPLCRTVEETVEIMSRLPKTIFSAVDTNHIKDPEKLIRAMGKRLKSLHIADGDGKKECHFLPCSGEGQNNWTDILSALNEASYKGPFMFECAYKDVKDLKECYEQMYNRIVADKNR